MCGMSQNPADRRSVRIGDAERDAAVEKLREHLVAGRLSMEEFDDRMAKAVAAKTSADLDPLFADLPRDPNAVDGVSVWRPPAPPASTRQTTLRTVQRWMMAVTPLVIVLWVLNVPKMWVIIVIWIVVFVVLGKVERMLGQPNHPQADDRRSLY